ncbi:MAG: patatin-like phospholipase family protein [Chloroflexota bacterium]
MRPARGCNVIGLALSGGGIRSSAFCLGVMQALNTAGLIEKVDYLSTVSGGGYIGMSMTAAMSEGTAGKFPFASELRKNEPPGLQHIRDHSNYLFPQGLLNIFGNVVVYLRGLAANAVLLLPWLLLAAAFTIWSNPDVNALTETDVAGYLVHLPISVPHFGLTLNAALCFVILLALWALWRSTPQGRQISDVGFGARFFGVLLVGILVVAFFEFQPLVLYGMFRGAGGGALAKITSSLKSLAEFLVPFGTVAGFLGRFLGDGLKRTTDKPGGTAFAMRIAIKFAMYLAGAAVPLALWIAYLYLSFWGIQNCGNSHPCTLEAPAWLMVLAGAPFIGGKVLLLYFSAGLALVLISLLLDPNANSLNRLYRDRLSKAFLFNPSKRMTAPASPYFKSDMGKESEARLRNSDLEPLDRLKLSELRTDEAPISSNQCCA